MKKICALIMLVMLSLPGAAQAYYFEVTSFNFAPQSSVSSNASNDTHGDQVDFVANAMNVGGSMGGQVSAQFVLYSDYGRNIVTGVNATLTDISNYFSYGTGTSYLYASSSFKLFEPSGEGWMLILSDDFSQEASEEGASRSANSLEYYDLTLITSLTYQLVFSYTSNSIGQFSTANREISIDVNQEDIPQTPIPGAVWLLGTGLMGLVGLRRKLG